VRLTGVEHITLTVSDLDRASQWCRDVLGFEDMLRYRNDAIHRTCYVLTHPDLEGFVLSFMQCDGTADGSFDERTLGLDHFSFGVGDRSSLDQWRSRLDRQGVTTRSLSFLEPRSLCSATLTTSSLS